MVYSKYQEHDGVPIIRRARQLGEMEKAITRELELGVRNPEGSWDWVLGAEGNWAQWVEISQAEKCTCTLKIVA